MPDAAHPPGSLTALPFCLGVGDMFLTRREAAGYLRRSVPTLERWAAAGEGPPFRRVGGKTLYPLHGLREFALGVRGGPPGRVT